MSPRPVSVVGLGAMGSRVARRLLEAGYAVTVWNRSPGRTAALVRLGASAAATPAEAARRAEMLITMVADPESLRAVTEGPDGVAAGAHPSLTVIEMSTVGPAAVSRLTSALPGGTGLLDAPVLGSISEAETGSLTIFAGGAQAVLGAAMPLLSTLGSVIHTGPSGSGAAAKLVANAALFAMLGTLGEAIALGRGLGLSQDALGEILAVTPLAGQASRRRQAIQAGDYPPRFALTLARKDADLVSAAAAAAGVDLRLAAAARSWLAAAETTGWGDRDYTAMLAAILGQRRRREPPAGTSDPWRQHSYDGLIVDLDGVVWRGGSPVEGAAEAIGRLRAVGTQVVFLTNDPQGSRDEQAARLTAMGIPTGAADVITSAYASAHYIASRPDLDGCRALVTGPAALRDEVARAGIGLVPAAKASRAGMVIVGGHERFDYAELHAATTAVSGGALLFATGRDPVVPARDGLMPATGAILAAIETATGVTATVIGKPEPYVFRLARHSLRACHQVAVVGDNLAADIAGAKRAGLGAILVLTGTATVETARRFAIQPDLIVPSVATLPTELHRRGENVAPP